MEPAKPNSSEEERNAQMEAMRLPDDHFHSQRTLHPMQVETCATAGAKCRYECDHKIAFKSPKVPGEIILESGRLDDQRLSGTTGEFHQVPYHAFAVMEPANPKCPKKREMRKWKRCGCLTIMGMHNEPLPPTKSARSQGLNYDDRLMAGQRAMAAHQATTLVQFT